MMNRFLYITGILLIISTLATGQAVSYKVGEKVTYSIQYGFISAGTGTLELKSDTFNGREVWHSILAARTTGMAEALFKVIDIYESYIDPAPNYLSSQSEIYTKAGTGNTILFCSIIRQGPIPVFLQAILQGNI